MVAAQILNQQNPIETVEDYIFDNPIVLLAGDWKLQINKGHAWIFCDTGNFTVEANETLTFKADDGKITIRRLYVKSVVHLTAHRFA